MKIILIQPPSLQSQDSYSSLTQPSIGLAYLAAYAASHGFEVKAIDGVGEAIARLARWPAAPGLLIQGLPLDQIAGRVPKDADVVGFSCMFTHAWPMVRELIRKVRDMVPGAVFMAGGEHATAMPEAVLRQSGVDLVCCGEGEETFLDILKTVQAGGRDWSRILGVCFLDKDKGFVRNPARERIRDLDRLPYPDWDALGVKSYMDSHIFMGPSSKDSRSIPLLATRGCPYSCTFCASPNMWTRRYRMRDPKKVVDEMEHWMRSYGANDFQLQDLTAIVRKDWIMAFCREVIARKLQITWQIPVGTRSEAIDSEVTDVLVASGCRHITYAPESGSRRILKVVKKGVDLDKLEASVRAALGSGMTVCLFMILGFPQETPEDLRDTLRFIRRMAVLGVHETAVSTFVPFPGTALFEEACKVRPVTLDDEYCYGMTGATRLFRVRSWNPALSDSQLRRLKLFSMAQFYGISFAVHPSRVWKLARAAVTGEQETKMDRVLREFAVRIKGRATSETRRFRSGGR